MPGLNVALNMLFVLAVADTGPSSSDVLQQAETAFQLGVASRQHVQQARQHFARAAELFEELHQRGVRSPGLYVDLGNAEFLAGHPERALWAYQSGLQLDPNARVLRERVAMARGRVEYPADAQPDSDPWPMWLAVPTPRILFFAGSTGYALVCVFGLLWWRRRGTRLLAGLLASASLLAGSLAALGWLTARADHDRAHPLVVVMDETPLYRGNGTSYPLHPDLPRLPRGVEARLLVRRGAWLQVQFTSGVTGWLPAAAARVVAVAPSP